MHGRSGGHPFFARELCRALAAGEDPTASLPRSATSSGAGSTRCPEGGASLVGVAAVAGSTLSPDVLATVTDRPPAEVRELLTEATDAGVLLDEGGLRFAHDLYREAALDASARRVRVELHARLAEVLAGRRGRGTPGPGGRSRPARRGRAAGCLGRLTLSPWPVRLRPARKPASPSRRRPDTSAACAACSPRAGRTRRATGWSGWQSPRPTCCFKAGDGRAGASSSRSPGPRPAPG